jgi:hypothetical protein
MEIGWRMYLWLVDADLRLLSRDLCQSKSASVKCCLVMYDVRMTRIPKASDRGLSWNYEGEITVISALVIFLKASQGE